MAIREASRQAILRAAILSALAMLCAAALTPLLGSADIDLTAALLGRSPDREILFQTRLPRVILSLLTGGALAVSGVLFQALLRDALATPYVLGVSSGASLGAVIAIAAGWSQIFGFQAVWFCAVTGAFLTLLLVAQTATRRGGLSSFTLLLTGVTINSMAMALILLIHSFVGFRQSFAITRWLMGAIDLAPYHQLALLACAVLGAVLIAFLKSREWNLLALGEDWAAARGLSPSRELLKGYILGSFLAGSVTALTGPIGFVGLIVPHAIRLIAGADHRLLLPCSFFLGATFLALCDMLARTVLAPDEIPVGVVTALIGGPCFIWMLRRRQTSP